MFALKAGVDGVLPNLNVSLGFQTDFEMSVYTQDTLECDPSLSAEFILHMHPQGHFIYCFAFLLTFQISSLRTSYSVF